MKLSLNSIKTRLFPFRTCKLPSGEIGVCCPDFILSADIQQSGKSNAIRGQKIEILENEHDNSNVDAFKGSSCPLEHKVQILWRHCYKYLEPVVSIINVLQSFIMTLES